jgi:hypothetical protein
MRNLSLIFIAHLTGGIPMKKLLCLALVLFILAALCACKPAPVTVSVTTATPSAADPVSAAVSAAATPLATPAEAATTAPPSATLMPSPSPSPTGPAMYSSYAHLKTFDPATGVAQFDYFDMLTGDAAVSFLVSHEGYTQSEAQPMVAEFADSEFVEKNTNPQLRAIDLRSLSLSLMYQPSGAEVTDAEPVPSTYSDFLAIWTLNPALLRDHYFFYIHVNSGGSVYHVEQVFWP